MKSIPAGRYLMGVEFVGEHTTKYVLVPLGPRNVAQWEKTVFIARDDFDEFMSDRISRERRARATAEDRAAGHQQDAKNT